MPEHIGKVQTLLFRVRLNQCVAEICAKVTELHRIDFYIIILQCIFVHINIKTFTSYKACLIFFLSGFFLEEAEEKYRLFVDTEILSYIPMECAETAIFLF